MNTKKHFKKTLLIAAAVAAVVFIFACTGGNKEGGTTGGKSNAAQKLLESVPFTQEGLVSMVKSSGELTETEYEALILAYSKCKINQETLKLEENPVHKTRSVVRDTHKNPSGEIVNAVQKRLLNHESPLVRGFIVEGVQSLFGVNKENVQAVLDMLKNEKDLYVINSGINALSNEMKDDGVAAFIFAQAKNENSAIRTSAAKAIGNSWSAGVSGATEAIIALINDKDQNVRGSACAGSGKLGDERVIAELVKVLDNPAEAEIHNKCISGLCTLWFDYPFHEKTSKAAYDATLNYLKKTPRTKDVPSWTTVGSFKTFNEDKLPEWEKKATYFNRSEIVAVMSSIAADADANWLGRKSAVEAIAQYGTKADLEKLQKTVETNTGDDNQSHVLNKIKEKLEKNK